MEEAESLSDRVGIMAKGSLIDVGTPKELIEKSNAKDFEDAFVKIAIGILIGSTFTEKASSGISSIVVQLVCFTGEIYFPKEMLGDMFAKICNILPFESCVTIIKGIMNNNIQIISLRNIIVFLTYTIVVLAISIIVFKRKMVSDNK